MARIRTIKPEFWKNEQLSAMPAECQLLAAALLNYADDHGYFNANPALVHADCAPLRNISGNIPEYLRRLQAIGYIRLGRAADGRTYGQVVKFKQHQRVSHPSDSKISEITIDWDASGIIPESSAKAPEVLGPEREQGTGNGKEKDLGDSVEKAFESIWPAYPKRAGGNSKADALKAYRARVRDGHTPNVIAAGVERYAAFCQAKGQLNTEYVKQAATFFGPGLHFLEAWEPPAARGQTAADQRHGGFENKQYGTLADADGKML